VPPNRVPDAAPESQDAAPTDSSTPADGSTDDAATDDASTADSGGDGGVIVPIATGLYYPWHMAVGGGYVYVVDGNGMEKVSVNGGKVTTIDIGSGSFIAADATNVYWTSLNGDVYRQPHTGGLATKIGASVASSVNSVATDGAYVYWTEYLNGGRVKRIAVGANGVTVAEDVSPPMLYPMGVAFAGGSVFVAEHLQNTGTISKVLPDGGVTPIASNRYAASYPVSDGTHIFWWDDYGGSDTVAGVGTDGTGLTTFSTHAYHPTLATDGTSLYYANASGGIMKAPVTGGTPATLYSSLGECEAFATDGAYLYWAIYADGGAIYKAPK
jgi:hypothetical protein